MIFKKIKEIITRKKDQNVKSDALLEEEKNELIIERFVENHNDVINWSKEDQERLEKLVNPKNIEEKKIRKLPNFCQSYLSVYFIFKENDYTIIGLEPFGDQLGLKKLVNTKLVSIRQKDSKKVNYLHSPSEKQLEKFNYSTKEGTEVIIKYKKKNSKIHELLIKTGSFNDYCNNNINKWESCGLSKEQANTCNKEWKREYFYSGFLPSTRMQEIKDKNLKYEKKTLIDKFLSLKEEDNIDNWPVHLLNRVKPILKPAINELEKFRKFSMFRGSYLSFFYESPKNNKNSFAPNESSLVVNCVSHDQEEGSDEISIGDTLISISELKPVRTGKIMREKTVDTVKLKTQVDLIKFLYKYKPGTNVLIGFKTKKGVKKTTIYKTRSFHEHIMEGLKKTYLHFCLNNNTKADLIIKEYKQNYIQGLPDLTLKRIEEIRNMDLMGDEDKKRIIEKFSTFKYEENDKGDDVGGILFFCNKEDIKLLKKLLKPRFNELNFETSAFNLYFNPQLVEYFKKFNTKIKKDISSCITYMLNWYVPGGADSPKNVKNFEKLVSAKNNEGINKGEILIYDTASDKKKGSFFENAKKFSIKYLSNQNGKLETKEVTLTSPTRDDFASICQFFSTWLNGIHKNKKIFHKTKTNLAMKEWRESFFEGYPDFTLQRLNEIKEMDLEDDYYEEEDYSDEEYNDNEEKIYLSTTVKKEKVAGKESFVLTLDGFPDDEKLETLADGKKIFLKIYVFDVTDLDSDKYYEIADTTGLTDQYFSNHCHVIKTNEITWSDENMNLIQSKKLEPYGDHPTKLAFPYSVMLLPKVGMRKLSFRTFLCTDKQKFDDAEGRPKDGESINYRPESFKMDDDGEYGFDDYGDYSEILSYVSSEIEVEYKQPGYLDINRRKYNDLTIALGLALNQLEGKNLKENFEKIKNEIRYDGDYSAEGNIYKSLSLKSNYESALNKKIDLESILKELKKNSRIHERYEMIDLLLNLAITDQTYSAKENEFIDKVAKSLDLHNEKFQEIKKRKTASVKFVDFGDKADESIFGITKDMDKKEKLRVLRKEYSRWNALTNNSDKAIRERAREMRDLAANIRRQYT